MRYSRFLHNNITIIGILLILSLIRVPYWLTNHIQEDAYIHFQMMRSFAASGVYGFNLGELVSGSTSPLYIILMTPLFSLFGTSAIYFVLFVNAMALNISLLIFVKLLCSAFSRMTQSIIWICLSLLPVSLVLSYSGMETSILLLCLALLARAYTSDRNEIWGFISIIALLYLRIDSVMFVAIFLTLVFITKRKRFLPIALLSVAVIGTYFVIHKIVFDSWVPQTIIAKATTYGIIDKTLQSRLNTLLMTLSSVMMPINTKYIYGLAPLWIGALFVNGITGWIVYRDKPQRNLVLLIILFSIIPPFFYGLSGTNVFEWYIWPCSICAYSVIAAIIAEVLQSSHYKRLASSITLAIVIGFSCAQWFLSFSRGTQEFLYRRSIGTWIRADSNEQASIMLEPIGYIGFFSERYIHDEVGLVSPEITHYRMQFGHDWWGKYIRDFHPTYIVERAHILKQSTMWEPISNEDFSYFQDNYKLVKKFSYQPSDYYSNPLLLDIAKLGDSVDYYIFKNKDD